MTKNSQPIARGGIQRSCIALVALLIVSGAVSRGDFVQLAGQTYLGVEAEAYDASTAGSRLLVVDKTPTLVTPYGTAALPAYANASGDSAILTNFSGTANTLTYDLVFNTAGDYIAYAHYSLFEGAAVPESYGNEDSYFMSNAFNDAVSSDDPHTFDMNNLGVTPASGVMEGHYFWQPIRFRGGSNPAVFTVAPADLGNTLTWQVRPRESGSSLDYILFSTTPDLTGEELDLIIGLVPEPSSLVLLALGGAFLTTRRRRG